MIHLADLKCERRLNKLPEGIILKGVGGFYYVKTSNGIYECKARGIFRKKEITPLPGDKVIIGSISEQYMSGNIEEILERQSILVRPAVANVDKIVLTLASKSPEPDMMLLDKILITALTKNIDVLICVNKLDIDEANFNKISECYTNAGFTVIGVRKDIPESYNRLIEQIGSHINVFAGQSGVGKSTLMNKILNSEVMETGSVSSKIERGKHTTRHAQLLPLSTGGYIVDTPGFSSFELEGIDEMKLMDYYPDFQRHLGGCRFDDCIHVNEPDCAVKNAVDNGEICRDRYERYVKLYLELKEKNNIYKGKNKNK